MKIIHIISSFSPGGAEILVKKLAIALSLKNQVEVWAIAQSKDEPFARKFKQELHQNQVKMFQFYKPYHRKRFSIILELRRKIKESKPDIINTHLEYINLFTIMATLGLPIPLVHTVHNIKIDHIGAYRYLFKYFNRRFIAISEKVKKTIEKQLKVSSEKVNLIYNGVNIETFYNPQRKERKTVNHIIAVGRLTRQKDYPNLLKAYKALLGLLSPYHTQPPQLNIVGEGELRKDLMEWVKKLEITPQVNFLGIRDDIPRLLAQNDLYVLSSRWEGFSISLIEALAAGMPVIATAVGSSDEIVYNYNNGLLVPPGQPDLLAKAIFKLIMQKELRAKLAGNGPEIAKKFNLKACAEGYLALYRDIYESISRK